ncbi:hypothetical protein L3067_04005 [Xanthomonas sp. PPL568]|uniref:hypothetical protein n=1 Tax=Xanthomonas indica TaxID=2912242 RepID=UPI001F59A671|nr:hypothetical protein [Xanthomonas indica]MCI2243770.1 hypothetical protein [Xanthomonas indica]
MATGAKVWTNGGSVLTIDQSYENLSLYSSGSAQTSSANPELEYGVYTLTLTLPSAAIPQLALRTQDPSKYIGILGVTINGSTYSFLIRTAGGPVAFDWYIFSLPAFIAPSTRGLKVWRPSDRRLVFDSGMRWMRVAGQIVGNTGRGQLDSSRKYAIAFAGACVQQSRQWINQPETTPAQVDQYTYVPGARVVNGVFESADMTVHVVQTSQGAPADLGYISNGVFSVLALDISGY